MSRNADSYSNPLFERFLELENREELFDVQINGVDIWERIRHKVYNDIERAATADSTEVSSSGSRSGYERYVNAAMTFTQLATRKNPFLTDEHDVFVYGHPRRKQQLDGYWWDIYFDPIYEELDLDYFHLEDQFRQDHLTPAKTTNLRYSDTIVTSAVLWRKTGIDIPTVKQADLDELARIEARIESEFEVELDLRGIVNDVLQRRRPLSSLYRWLLRRVNPAVVLLVVSYTRGTFIETCKQMDVPVVELQHGTPTPDHPGYAFPGERTKQSFPDYLFTYGDFWTERISYPIDEDRIYSVGYPYLEQQKAKYSDAESDERILFISQGTIGEELTKFAADYASMDPDKEVVVKLHPEEYEGWNEQYPWLDTSKITVIDGDSPPLYELLATAAAQIGVYSTVIYEGLCFELDTYLLDIPGVEKTKHLTDRNVATLISKPEDLRTHLRATKRDSTFDKEWYFRSQPIRNIETALSDIRRREAN